MKKNSQRSSKARGQPRRLQEEQKRLRKEIKQLKAERDQYRRSLLALMHEDIPINKKALLGLVGKQRPLREFLAELAEGE